MLGVTTRHEYQSQMWRVSIIYYVGFFDVKINAQYILKRALLGFIFDETQDLGKVKKMVEIHLFWHERGVRRLKIQIISGLGTMCSWMKQGNA